LEEEDSADEDYDPAMDEGEGGGSSEDEGDGEQEEDGVGGREEGDVGRAGGRGSPHGSDTPPDEPAMLIEEVMALHQDARLSLQDVLGQHAAPACPAPADTRTGKGKSVSEAPTAERGAALGDDSD
jgi:hypothetical protein